MIVAFSVAVAADALQMMLGPLGWAFADQIIDLVAMGVVVWLVGFHPLLLPTFILELIPGIVMLPTWTACVAAVIVLRRNASGSSPVPAAQPGESSVSSGPIYSEDGEPQPPPKKEPRRINEVD